ncbi:MAG: sterol desaturase family protein [Gemmatimonadota bacterium]|nr:MAG: sterol desaturase family protein [Gemmatimonadota bacterium]
MAKLYVSNKDESVRMFRSDVLERFTHVHHTVPLILFVPLVALMLFLTYRQGMGIGRATLLFAVGVAIWSIVEYVVHRFGFHVSREAEIKVQDTVDELDPEQPALAAITGLEQLRYFVAHGVHHTHPNDTKRLVMPPIVSVPLAILFYWIFKAVFGPVDMLPAFAGLVTGYLLYDMTHYAVHHVRPQTRLGRYLKKHHFRHHYMDPRKNYGVSSPIWDIVWGTLNRTVGAETGPDSEEARA